MRKTIGKVKEQNIPPEKGIPPTLEDGIIDTSHLEKPAKSNRLIPDVSSGIPSLDEAFENAFKKRPPKPNNN